MFISSLQRGKLYQRAPGSYGALEGASVSVRVS